MSLEVKQFIDVRDRLAQLGLRAPKGVSILPRNVESASEKTDLLYESSTLTLRKLWKQGGFQEDRIEMPGDSIPTIAEKDATLTMPIIFISAAFLSENPTAVSLALNILGNYITEYFMGTFGRRRVKFSIVVERTPSSSYKRLEYDGVPEALPDLVQLVKEVSNDSTR
jgi:hypothetical protein